jgi:hypothetical protein
VRKLKITNSITTAKATNAMTKSTGTENPAAENAPASEGIKELKSAQKPEIIEIAREVMITACCMLLTFSLEIKGDRYSESIIITNYKLN